MDINLIITNLLAVIGGVYTVLKIVAPMTKWTGDDKVLRVFNKIVGIVNITNSND